MPTKTEYRKYIGSEKWQRRRKHFLLANPSCNRCGLSRADAVVAYDQDLNVHHRNYVNVGNENDEDLEPLCRRCHELESNGHTDLEVWKPTAGTDSSSLAYQMCFILIGNIKTLEDFIFSLEAEIIELRGQINDLQNMKSTRRKSAHA